VFYSEFRVHCQNYIGCSDFLIRYRIVCLAAKLGFAVEVVLSIENLKFAAKIELIAAN